MSWLAKVRSFFSKEEEATKQDLDSMKLAELRALAKNRGLKGISGLRKAQLLERLQRD
jgi:hypothetical protein